MTTVSEAVGTTKPPLGALLAEGVNVLDANQTITFTLYKKYILPADGFVFWINQNLNPLVGDPAATVNIKGALHFSTELQQEEESTISLNTIVFTALAPCDLFQQIDPQFMYLATWMEARFSFSSQGKYFQQADLQHYIGVAVTAVMNTQIIDTQAQLDAIKPIVSNSLPVWLAMPSYVPPYPGFTCPFAKMYPSFLVPENEPPPYASVHIEDTEALVQTAMLGPKLTSSQLTRETVKVTLYGVNSDDCITFLNFVTQYSYDWNYIGMSNMPIIRDEKLTQPEIQTIAQKKSIEFKVNYIQTAIRDIARQFIEKFKVTYYPSSSGIKP